MKSITESYLFKKQDEIRNIKKKFMSYDPSMDNLDINLLEEQLLTIRKRFNYPAKNIILDDLGKTIIPIYNLDRMVIPSYIPAFLTINRYAKSNDDRVIAVVNLGNYGSLNKKTNLFEIDNRKLFGLLQTGEVMLTCFKKWNSITMSQSICKLGSLLYSRMFVKVLDKMFAVNFDPVKADKIKFVASKFFLINMLEKNSSSTLINNIAYSNCTNGTVRNTINIFDEEFNPIAYENFANLLQQIQLNIEGCGGLSVRTFIDTYAKMYGQNTLLAFDYFPFFLHTVFSVVIGARMNMEFVLEGVFGKEAMDFYNEFINFMRN